jgi:hypothetical protein
MFQGFGAIAWLAASVSVAVGGYMTTTYGAAERARLRSVETQIIDAKKDIRGLETEFSARASMAQLQQWSASGEAVAYGAPDAARYLASENQLASLDVHEQGADAKLQVASVTSPAPVVQPAVVQTAQVQAVAPQARVAAAPTSATKTQLQAAPAVAAAVAKVDRGRQVAAVQTPRVTRVAMLSSSTLADLDRGAVSEKRTLR